MKTLIFFDNLILAWFFVYSPVTRFFAFLVAKNGFEMENIWLDFYLN